MTFDPFSPARPERRLFEQLLNRPINYPSSQADWAEVLKSALFEVLHNEGDIRLITMAGHKLLGYRLGWPMVSGRYESPLRYVGGGRLEGTLEGSRTDAAVIYSLSTFMNSPCKSKSGVAYDSKYHAWNPELGGLFPNIESWLRRGLNVELLHGELAPVIAPYRQTVTKIGEDGQKKQVETIHYANILSHDQMREWGFELTNERRFVKDRMLAEEQDEESWINPETFLPEPKQDKNSTLAHMDEDQIDPTFDPNDLVERSVPKTPEKQTISPGKFERAIYDLKDVAMHGPRDDSHGQLNFFSEIFATSDEEIAACEASEEAQVRLAGKIVAGLRFQPDTDYLKSPRRSEFALLGIVQPSAHEPTRYVQLKEGLLKVFDQKCRYLRKAGTIDMDETLRLREILTKWNPAEQTLAQFREMSFNRELGEEEINAVEVVPESLQIEPSLF
jgi:hypothetical protein